MCVAFFALNISRDSPLILAANRDEFYARPTLPMGWREDRRILAGHDLRSGGTWFGLNHRGRWGLLTNYREPRDQNDERPSRGLILAEFLSGSGKLEAFGRELRRRAGKFHGFNLIFAEGLSVFYFSNRLADGNDEEPRLLPAGLYGLSNHLLDTPWPKVSRGKAHFAKILSSDHQSRSEQLLAMLEDRSLPAEAQIPDTGLSTEWEQWLAPIFVKAPNYGTRVSYVFSLDKAGRVEVVERTQDPEEHPVPARRFSLQWHSPSP